MEDIARWQAVAACELGVPGFAAAQGTALLQKPRPCGSVDGPVHAAAAQQRGVGGIDDGLCIRLGNVPHHNGKASGLHELLCAEDPVASVSQTGNDVAPLIEALVHYAAEDIHIRVGGLDAGDSFRCGH